MYAARLLKQNPSHDTALLREGLSASFVSCRITTANYDDHIRVHNIILGNIVMLYNKEKNVLVPYHLGDWPKVSVQHQNTTEAGVGTGMVARHAPSHHHTPQLA